MLGWPTKRSGGASTSEAGAQVMNGTHILRLYNVLPWINVWELDATLWKTGVYIKCSDGEIKRYGRVSERRLPLDVEMFIAKHCHYADRVQHRQAKLQSPVQQSKLQSSHPHYYCVA
jgi:hypothetical protein